MAEEIMSQFERNPIITLLTFQPTENGFPLIGLVSSICFLTHIVRTRAI